MPIYLFEHIETGNIQEVVFHMNEEKIYLGPDSKNPQPGKWRRVWTKPRMSVDTACDPHSAKDFVKATNKPGSIGDLWDRSAELSAKRADKEGGRDPVKETYYADYAKKHKGKMHPTQKKEKGIEHLAKQGIKVEWGD